MSDHRSYEARFGALFDGDLEAEPRAEVEAHLADCAQCAAAWRKYTVSIDALRFPAALPTPHTHVTAVMARVAGERPSTASLRQPIASAHTSAEDVPARAASFAARRRATTHWRTLATHATALAAGALAMFALAPFFGAREATSITAIARASAAQEADARAVAQRESNRAVAAALALQQVALARALVERDAAKSDAAAEQARARAAEATLVEAQLVGAQLAHAQRTAALHAERERDALRREDERLTAAAQQRAEARRAGAERAEAQRAAAEAFAAVALVRSLERLGGTLARLDAELVARAEAVPRAEAVRTGAIEPTQQPAASARDWRAIDVDTAALAATGRRAEHVTIRREGDRVALSTSGSIDDIVEALLARLDDPDPAVRAAVELRLDDIAAELGVARAEGARSGRTADEPWWRSDRGQVAALTIDSTGGMREPWPSWWSRARSAVGR